MNTLRGAWIIAKKDLRIELRVKEIVVTTCLFSLLLAVLASFAFLGSASEARSVGAGALWVTTAFAGVVSMNRSWMRERENEVFTALWCSPVTRASIYWGKFFGALLFLLCVELMLVPIVALFFHVDLLAYGAQLAAIVVVGVTGFAAAGTLLASLAVRTRMKELALSIALFPLIAPALLCAVVATRELLGGSSAPELFGWLRILLAFDVIFLTLSAVLFAPLHQD